MKGGFDWTFGFGAQAPAPAENAPAENTVETKKPQAPSTEFSFLNPSSWIGSSTPTPTPTATQGGGRKRKSGKKAKKSSKRKTAHKKK